MDSSAARRIAGITVGMEFDGIAAAFQIPAGEVEEMNRLLEDPTADARRIVTPPARAEAVGLAQQFDENVLRLADGAALNDLLDLTPLRGQAKLVAQGEPRFARFRSGGDCPAILPRCGHPPLQQHV